MEIRLTTDGSETLFSGVFNETYHSINGAITESNHVFINAGLKQLSNKNISILEIGFGTGLNAFLTLLEADKMGFAVNYHSIEKYPVTEEIYSKLRYPQNYSPDLEEQFLLMHHCPWNKELTVTEYFKLLKISEDLESCDFLKDKYHLVYFDAFSPESQPELWTEAIFRKIFDCMVQGGILTTYCAKGQVRRNMQSVGFSVERLAGPPGKREMLRAIK